MRLNEEHVLLPGPASISDQSPAVAESSTPQDRLTGTPLCVGPEDVRLNEWIDQLLALRTSSRRLDKYVQNSKVSENADKSKESGERLAEELRNATTGEVPLQWKPTISKPPTKTKLKPWLAYHSACDVSTEEGLAAWRKKALNDPRICDAITPAPNTKVSGTLNLKKDRLAALKSFDNDAVQSNLETDYDVSIRQPSCLTLR
jgi:hypothetical protein